MNNFIFGNPGIAREMVYCDNCEYFVYTEKAIGHCSRPDGPGMQVVADGSGCKFGERKKETAP